ncbi:FtsX-like permease family protein [Ilyomonas limi]|uniref:FtsX-like permease family protein n=1 Tax=Ilyomonas limi TaxID=2575867 RepID=A0A4U3L411_9BACT|nr:ABC transporter permease [Ilyomonas limi]TKK68277.1 FtsX-like permease family protein [Ilyomonas limi]
MFKNYLKIAFRNLQRHKAYSFLNIAGLAIGMACSIFILLWVQNELSYDRFHKNADHLYRLTASVEDFKAAVSPAGMAAGLQSELPEIESAMRISKPATVLFETGDRKFEERNVLYVDANFLQVFSFRLVKGNRSTALQQANGILITENIAKKYFGDQNPIGKILRKDNQENVVVAGVLANAPSNSHLQFDIVAPMSAIATTNYDIKNSTWGNFDFYTYIQLKKSAAATNANLLGLAAHINNIFQKHNNSLKVAFHLQPLTSIHLHSDLQIDLPGNGNILYVNIFFAVAIFILAVACINFMNLATARSARRAKEVGLRKVVGASRVQVMLQFLGESLLISFVSLCLAVVIVWLLLPAFNHLAEKNLSLHLLDSHMLLTLAAIAFCTGLLSGSYPAIFLSGFTPATVLKGKLKPGTGNLLFRNGLVITQFVVSIVLLAGTAVVYKQLNFIKDKNLGFNKSNLLYINMTGDLWSKQQALKSELQQNPYTSDYTVVSDLPANLTTGTVDVQWEGKDSRQQIVVPSIDIDEHFMDVFQMKMLAGRSFSSAFAGDTSNYVVNEKALAMMGMNVDEAVGKNISFADRKGTIIGVVKDFNFKPLQYAIDPLVLRLNRYGGIVVVRARAGATEATIHALEQISHELNPAYPFTYHFLDKDLDNQYKGEQQMGSIFNLFAILAVFISCLGLYGLSAFMAEQRTKEIGVRKVLGASVFNIVYLLSGSFTKLIVVAMVIAVPVSYVAIHHWLNSFAYRVDVSWIFFVVACVAALVIALLTVSYESIKAAIANPVKNLRTE